jgi:acyl-CoA thioesterase-1
LGFSTKRARNGIGKSLAAILVLLAMAIAAPCHAEIRIVAIGDSNLDNPNLGPGQNYSDELEKALRAKGYDARVVNAGRRGDTTQSVIDRLDRDVPAGTDIAIVGVGVNDWANFGLSRETIGANLELIVKRLRARKIEVLLFGVGPLQKPGCCFGGHLAAKYGALFYRNFQDGLQDDPKLHAEAVRPTTIGDKSATAWHLNLAGNRIVVERTLPLVEQLIARVQAAKTH